MSEKKHKVPKLRFPGFTGDWELRKLGDVIDRFEYGLNAAATEYDGVHKYIRITDIDDVSHMFLKSNLTTPKIDFQDADTEMYKLKEGDILFARTGASVGKTYLYDINDGDLYFAGFLIRGHVNPSNNAKFVYQNTLTENYDLFIKITSQRSGQPGVNSKEYAEFKLYIPSKEEQEKISLVLTDFDNLIILHQRKLESLKLKKKALLQKLFPKNGEQFPELRFPGFTDAWEQRKLGEVVKSYSGGTPTASNKEYYGGDIPFIRSAEINSDMTELYITQKGLDNSSAKMVEKGTILYAMYGATSGEVGISKINGAINQAILAMIPSGYNSKIIAQYLRKNKESIIGKYLQGGQGNLSANIILDLSIELPGIEESNQIANFLESFDNIITLHQRKLEHLQLQKKALLQQMFV